MLNIILDFAIFDALADVIGAELFPIDTASKQLLKGLGTCTLTILRFRNST